MSDFWFRNKWGNFEQGGKCENSLINFELNIQNITGSWGDSSSEHSTRKSGGMEYGQHQGVILQTSQHAGFVPVKYVWG